LEAEDLATREQIGNPTAIAARHCLLLISLTITRMLKNRSVPADIILPHIEYHNLPEAIAWLTRVFGFTEHYRYGAPSGAQLFLGRAWIMVRQAEPGHSSPTQLGYGTQSLTIFVEDVDGQYRRVKESGARVVEELHETEYGERQFGV
jgi:uncharacterized glyoxalase superfamily protein PhnB